MSAKTVAANMPLAKTREDYYRMCWQILQSGRRPTADDLVERLRGSKSTAVNAINEFWATWLPTQIGTLKDTPPDPVAHAAKEFWALAVRHADNTVSKAHAAAQKQIDDERKSLDLNKASHELAHAQLLKDQQALAGELSGLRMKLMQTEQQLADAKRDREHAEQDVRHANERTADAVYEMAKVKHEFELQRAEYTKLQIDGRQERAELPK